MYYITICTKDRFCCFGGIKDEEVYLSEIGSFVYDHWIKIPGYYNNVKLDDFIIMPNHLHGIIVIEDNDFDDRRDTFKHVSTKNEFGKLNPKSLSAIINYFKGGVTRCCNENNFDFQWQSRFYEHIIRDEGDYARIKEYIANNPLNWQDDKNNPNNFK